MADSPILAIPQIAESQNNKYMTHNDAVDFLEAAANAKLAKAVSGSSDVTLTDDEATRYGYIVCSGATGNFNLVFPGEVGTANSNANRIVIVRNNTNYTMTVKSDAAGTTLSVAAAASYVIHQDHDDIVGLARFTGVTTSPYDVGFSITGQPGDGVETLRFVATRTIDFAANFSGSYGSCGTNPTATASMDVKKNGVTIGSISISTGGVFTFTTTSGTTKQLVAGDALTIVTPSPQDATLANVGVLFAGTRSA